MAAKAARSLADGARIAFRVVKPDGSEIESFVFTKASGLNRIEDAGGPSEVSFELTEGAAEAILSETSDDIGKIGVEIAKLVVSQSPERRVRARLEAGFLTLMRKGYVGVVTAGGTAFAAFLASRGLKGVGGIKSAIAKLRGST